MESAKCPECDAMIVFETSAPQGHSFQCPTCHTHLTVRTRNPLRLDWAFVEPLREWEKPVAPPGDERSPF